VKNERQLKQKMQEHKDMSQSLQSCHLNDMGAFLKSQHVKFFQDAYLKVGVYETTKANQELAVCAVKRALNFFPSLINWGYDCPRHVENLKEYYRFDEFNERPLNF